MDLVDFFTGVLTTIFCTGAVVFWKKVIVPWWQDRGYEGLKLDRTWHAEIPAKDGKFVFKMELDQKFHNVTGKLSITKAFDGDGNSQSELDVEGVYWESFLQLRGKSCVDNRLSFSVFLLKSVAGGSKLVGEYVFRALNSDEVVSHAIEFHQ